MSLIEAAAGSWLRRPSPAVLRARAEALPRSDAAVRQRLGWIWGLLVLNVMPYSARSTLIPLPTSAGKVLTQGALVVALLLALSINRRGLLRPNLFLFLMTLLCVTTTMVSVRGYFSFIGSDYRDVRLVLMVAILWLLTPWWGRRDLVLLEFHRRMMVIVLITVVAGIALSPTAAFAQAGGGRLGGTIWPIPPTQVAHYAAVLAGTTIVLWFSGLVRPKPTIAVVGFSVVVLLLTHTRTALLAMLVGILLAALSLFVSRRRVRRALGVTFAVAAVAALTLSPFLKTWFDRGETGQLDQLSGRAATWSALLAQPRTEFNKVFGYGISNDSFDGLPIDSSWLSTYLDQGLVGDVLDAAMLAVLIGTACVSPRGPRRALALFLAGYCLVASYTETGLGEASPYLLDLTVAMALVATPARLALPRVATSRGEDRLGAAAQLEAGTQLAGPDIA